LFLIFSLRALVYNDEIITLLEVKTRGKSPPEINSNEIRILQEFWNDAVSVVTVPDENIFYAQRINELEIQAN
jgi:hypothetical protein